MKTNVYRPRVPIVEAYQIDGDKVVLVRDSLFIAYPGDYVLVDTTGTPLQLMSKAVFEAMYEEYHPMLVTTRPEGVMTAQEAVDKYMPDHLDREAKLRKELEDDLRQRLKGVPYDVRISAGAIGQVYMFVKGGGTD